MGGLNHDYRISQRRDDPVACRELTRARGRCWRVLRQQAAGGRDPREERAVTVGVCHVDATAKHGEGGRGSGRQRSFMRGCGRWALDAVVWKRFRKGGGAPAARK